MSSLTAIPGNLDPQDEEDYRFKLNSTACEWGESYHPGGYHPVHLGDTFGNRYRVIRKLGYGSYSTVWLAIDLRLPRYVALKIAISSLGQATTEKEISIYQRLAEAAAHDSTDSQYLVCLQDSFEHHGPNGRHACFVFEPMGPNLTILLRLLHPTFQPDRPWEPHFPTQFARQALREILLGLRFLHANGIVHGDLHMGNILVNIRPIGMDNASLQRLEQSPSQGNPLRRLDDKVDQWAPLYLLEPVSLYDYTSLDLDPHVKITDFGTAFPEKDPPITKVVIPASLRAPELTLGLPYGKGIDIWSFGCLFFELLTGGQLFQAEDLEGDEFDEPFIDEYLLQLSEVLCPLPEAMFTKWRRGYKYFDPEGRRIKTWDDTDREFGNNLEGEGAEFADCQSPMSSQSVPLSWAKPFDSLEERFRKRKPEDIGEKEEKEILQLIHWILQHDPMRRPSASEILAHPWFAS